MKLIMIVPLMLSLVFVVACSRQGTGLMSDDIVEIPNATNYEIYEDNVVFLPATIGDSIQEELSYPHFLEDLAYMQYVLENNFALFDVAFWARGVDIPAIFANIHEEIHSGYIVHIDDFYASLVRGFSPLNNVGHFSFMSPAVHEDIVNDGRAWQNHFFPTAVYARLRYPHVMAFYEPRHPGNLDIGIINSEESRAESLRVMSDEAFLHWMAYVGLFVNREMVEEITQAFLDGDYIGAARLERDAQEIISDTPNVVTEIIKEGSIAYLAVNSFWASPAEGEAEVFNFYEEIRGFDHLIIDLRRNRGGSADWFRQNIMGPNIDSVLSIEGFAFLSYGHYAAEFIPASGLIRSRSLNPVTIVQSIDDELREVAEVLEDSYLPYINMDDMERMDYGFRIRARVSPNRSSRFDNQPAFSGKIWMLTGPWMTSATQISAWIAYDTGFATLVGEITGGHYGGARTMVALPNSGIVFTMDTLYVTDRHGRPLEAGTIPHHFNREGMDALETVLAMIAERNNN